ncbi:unnamed protein product [Phytophthora fragariaefolia]|uniref:Unnamed protein product n=1 Tax=Phytophthora fragariaefolia TaxID=1490495 RepID=A0A9W7CXQ6_9STRA|nr:unnamed protein product [Phytophthora fragariaefolia]
MFDTVERMANAPGSEIKLTDRTRINGLACAMGKQSKNNQSKKDADKNAPIDRIGGVICSDRMGPMTPMDRNGNRYLVNFVDHHTNYCRVFEAKRKDQVAKMFEGFLMHFERQFNCKVHVLCTDGGGDYRNVGLFCQSTGVVRQVSEAKNQASNGKAERMHRTILNMARCMIFASGLALHIWGDAVHGSTAPRTCASTACRANSNTDTQPGAEACADCHGEFLGGPKNYREAVGSARADAWSKIMTEPISALEANNTWELVAKP